jgi:hypothetical protein
MKIEVALCKSHTNSSLAFHLDKTKYSDSYKEFLKDKGNPTQAGLFIANAEYLKEKASTFEVADTSQAPNILDYAAETKTIIKINDTTFAVPLGCLGTSSTFEIEEVDTDKPWRIDKYDGFQTVRYLQYADEKYNMYM